jgi:hypothetical protein
VQVCGALEPEGAYHIDDVPRVGEEDIGPRDRPRKRGTAAGVIPGCAAEWIGRIRVDGFI